jgi:hypothetical protein
MTQHEVMKTYGGAEVKIHLFFILTLDGEERLASRSGGFNVR